MPVLFVKAIRTEYIYLDTAQSLQKLFQSIASLNKFSVIVSMVTKLRV